jgi:hypothetical protein
MNFLKKFLGKIGKSNVAKKVSDAAGEANYGTFADGPKRSKDTAKQLPPGDFSKAADHPIFSKDNTKKYRESKYGAKRAARNEKIWKAVKYGVPASIAVSATGSMLRSAESASHIAETYRREQEEKEKKNKRIWQR